jgi:hypothetical protein
MSRNNGSTTDEKFAQIVALHLRRSTTGGAGTIARCLQPNGGVTMRRRCGGANKEMDSNAES